MQTFKTLIDESGLTYSSYLKYSYDGFVNNHDYEIDLTTETQNLNGGTGYITNTNVPFNVNYQNLKVQSKPSLTQLCNRSAVKANWGSLVTNPGVLSGQYEYIDNFIFYGNTALNLEIGTTLTYNTTNLPENCLFVFTIKLPKTYNGLMCDTINNNYKIGYDNSQQKFYTIINNITTYYIEQTKITENPFIIFVLSDHIIIRQYNIYNLLDNTKDFLLDDMADLPLDFMVQENN